MSYQQRYEQKYIASKNLYIELKGGYVASRDHTETYLKKLRIMNTFVPFEYEFNDEKLNNKYFSDHTPFIAEINGITYVSWNVMPILAPVSNMNNPSRFLSMETYYDIHCPDELQTIFNKKISAILGVFNTVKDKNFVFALQEVDEHVHNSLIKLLEKNGQTYASNFYKQYQNKYHNLNIGYSLITNTFSKEDIKVTELIAYGRLNNLLYSKDTIAVRAISYPELKIVNVHLAKYDNDTWLNQDIPKLFANEPNIILGDFNNKYYDGSKVTNFGNFFKTAGYIPIVPKSTGIDNIFFKETLKTNSFS